VNVVRLHSRRAACIWVFRGNEGAWLVLLPNGHGWLHGDLDAALDDAEWLAENFGWPIRMPRGAAA
jgi:hypothetical protein